MHLAELRVYFATYAFFFRALAREALAPRHGWSRLPVRPSRVWGPEYCARLRPQAGGESNCPSRSSLRVLSVNLIWGGLQEPLLDDASWRQIPETDDSLVYQKVFGGWTSHNLSSIVIWNGCSQRKTACTAMLTNITKTSLVRWESHK